jgi:hypothetical protein
MEAGPQSRALERWHGTGVADRGNRGYREKIVGLVALALIVSKPRQAHCRAQLPGLCLLRSGNRERMLEIRLRPQRVVLYRATRRRRLPWSTTNCPPVVLEARSEHRKSTMLAISSTVA